MQITLSVEGLKPQRDKGSAFTGGHHLRLSNRFFTILNWLDRHLRLRDTLSAVKFGLEVWPEKTLVTQRYQVSDILFNKAKLASMKHHEI